MVWKRRFVKRRKFARRPRKARVPRALKVSNNYTFRRLGQLMRITQNGAGAITVTNGANSLFTTAVAADSMSNTIQWGNSFVFKLSSVIDPGDFTNLYDRYKILAVKLKIMYQASDASVGGLGVLPIINYCKDYDDATAPTSLNIVNVKQRAKSRILSGNKEFTITLKPKVAVPLYQGIAAFGYTVAKAPWVDSSYPDSEHYGLKMWINNFYAPASSNNQITIQPMYYLAMKDPQ